MRTACISCSNRVNTKYILKNTKITHGLELKSKNHIMFSNDSNNFRFDGPVKITCFENLVKDTISEVGTWLDFLDLDHRRLGCIRIVYKSTLIWLKTAFFVYFDN
jgi:hypothetical protein